MKKFSLIEQASISGLDMKKIYVRDYNFRVQLTADNSFYLKSIRHVVSYSPDSFSSLELEDFSSMRMIESDDVEKLVENVEYKKGLLHMNESFSFFGKPMCERYACDSKAFLLKNKQRVHAESAPEERFVYEGKTHIAIPHNSNDQLYRLPSGELSIIPERNNARVIHLDGVPHEHKKEVSGENTLYSFHNLHTGNTFTVIVPFIEETKNYIAQFFSLGGKYYMVNKETINGENNYTLRSLVSSDDEKVFIPYEEILFTFPGAVTVVNGIGFVVINNRSKMFDCNHTFYILHMQLIQ